MSRNLNKREINTLAEIIARTSPEAFIAAYNAMMPNLKVWPQARVLISVDGGNVEFETFGHVEVDKCDFDNLEAAGLDYEQRNAEYEKMKRWLNTGKLEEEEAKT